MEQYNYMPIGTVVSYAGATTPIGWLLCDGRTIEEHEYPDLYRVLGSGVLPDLRGEFVRGLDNGRGLDGGRVLGSEQGDAINLNDRVFNTYDRKAGDGGSYQGENQRFLISGYCFDKIDVKPSNNLIGHSYGNDDILNPNQPQETRPKNVALNYIIKAFNTTTDTETLPIQMAKALNNKIENNYNDQLDATVDIVGKEFYDYIQNSGEKTAGKIYRDRLQKGIFRCLKTTTSVLNTSEFYEPLSNNDLLGKLQNLQNSSVKIAEETFFWESGDGWSADITLQKFAKNGIVTREVISFTKPAQRGSTIAKTYDITIPTSDKFPPKYWGVPLGVGTDDPAFGYGGSSVVEYPGRILLNFKSIVPNTNPFTLEYTWIYNL